MLYLTSWRRLHLPEGIVRVGISLGIPRGWHGLREPRLTPSAWSMLRLPRDQFEAALAEQLAAHDPHEVYRDLIERTMPLIPALCCWEILGGANWCHRTQVGRWLSVAGLVRELP